MGFGKVAMANYVTEDKALWLISVLPTAYEVGHIFRKPPHDLPQEESLSSSEVQALESRDDIYCYFTFPDEKSIDNMIESLRDLKTFYAYRKGLSGNESVSE